MIQYIQQSMTQYSIIWFLVIAVLIYIIYNIIAVYNKKENFDSTLSQSDMDNAKLIFDFFDKKSDIIYPDYLDYLVSIKNTNLKIINQDTFHDFKALKKINKLTIQDIVNAMSK
jgi:hypothetical protein